MSQKSMLSWTGCVAIVISAGCGAGEIAGDSIGACDAARCAELGKDCGEVVIEDCGLVLCGQCPEGQTCGGGGTPNVCGSRACDWQCETPLNGFEADGCGNRRANPRCDPGVADRIPPVVTISSPPDGQVVSKSVVPVTGTASDDVAVAKVEVKLGQGEWELAAGTASWSKSVTLVAGANVIYARAVDTSENVTQASVAVTYVSGSVTSLRGSRSVAFFQMPSPNSILSAKNNGFNTVRTGLRSAYVRQHRSSKTDPLKEVIAYCGEIGMKYVLILDIDEYPPNGRETFYSSAERQQQFLTDMTWAVDRYSSLPAFWAIELEEPHRYSSDANTAEAYRNAMNAFFLQVKARVPSGVGFGFNLASRYKGSQMLQGFDVDFVNSKRIFTYYDPQLAFTTKVDTVAEALLKFQNAFAYAEAEFPDLEVVPTAYITHSSLTSQPACQPTYSSKICWNQAFFEEVRWLKSQGMPFAVFIGEWLGLNSLFFWDTTPGATVADKIREIIGPYVPVED